MAALDLCESKRPFFFEAQNIAAAQSRRNPMSPVQQRKISKNPAISTDTEITETEIPSRHDSMSTTSRAGSLDGLLSERPSRPPPPRWVQFLVDTRSAVKATLLSSPANWLLVVLPFAIASSHLGWNEAVVFILNFLAIFPLAELLSYSTEELSASVGQIVGGMLNATFGNAVEMIVGGLHIMLRVLWLTIPKGRDHSAVP